MYDYCRLETVYLSFRVGSTLKILKLRERISSMNMFKNTIVQSKFNKNIPNNFKACLNRNKELMFMQNELDGSINTPCYAITYIQIIRFNSHNC